MPIPLVPNKTFPYILRDDKANAPEPKPVFIFRCMTGKEQMEVAEILDKVEAKGITKYAIEQIFLAVRFAMVNWENLPIPFDLNRLPELVNYREALELAYASIYGLSDDDKKKLESLLASNTGACAQPAKDT